MALAAATAGAAVFALSARTDSAGNEQREMRAITRAVFANDQLWMLHDDGSLVSLRPDGATPEGVATGGRAIEICRSNNDVLAVVAADKDRWTVKRRLTVGWASEVAVLAEGDTFVALACTPDTASVALVTNRRLIEVEGAQVRAAKLSPELEPPFVAGTALIDQDAVWVGLNVGEWGGGLRRIARATGKTETVEHNRSGQLCGGPLNTACDPVNGLVASPKSSSCILAAIGLVHMMSHGRIVEICGDSVRRRFFKPLDPQPPRGELDDGEPSSTVAFFGLARAGERVWALGIDGLYRFDGSTQPRFQELPRFEDKGGYRVSFAVPGIVLVMTDVNQRRSMSGAVPIMAIR